MRNSYRRALLTGVIILTAAVAIPSRGNTSTSTSPTGALLDVACGAWAEPTFTFTGSYTTPVSYTTQGDAETASNQGNTDQLIYASGVKCNNEGCLPNTCTPQVWCSVGCPEYTQSPGYQSPPNSGKWYATGSYDGEYFVSCSECDT